ncbi:hypothetical protein GCM10009744_09350 [Kribbella alba]|uniref:UBA domain-containing protein n=2 Tax=Kribbella alba TaxID=190197 RepID=A0ABN2F1W3_9ACTN
MPAATSAVVAARLSGPAGPNSAVRRMLVEAGFAEPEFESIEELMSFGPDVETAERFALGALGWLLDPLDPPARDEALRTPRPARGPPFRLSRWF